MKVNYLSRDGKDRQMIEYIVAAYFPNGLGWNEQKMQTTVQKSVFHAAREFAKNNGLDIIADRWEQPTKHGETRSFATMQGIRIWVYAQDY